MIDDEERAFGWISSSGPISSKRWRCNKNVRRTHTHTIMVYAFGGWCCWLADRLLRMQWSWFRGKIMRRDRKRERVIMMIYGNDEPYFQYLISIAFNKWSVSVYWPFILLITYWLCITAIVFIWWYLMTGGHMISFIWFYAGCVGLNRICVFLYP